MCFDPWKVLEPSGISKRLLLAESRKHPRLPGPVDSILNHGSRNVAADFRRPDAIASDRQDFVLASDYWSCRYVKSVSVLAGRGLR